MKKYLYILMSAMLIVLSAGCSSDDESYPEGAVLPISVTDGEIVDFFNSEFKERHHSGDYYRISTSFFYDTVKYGGMGGINKDTIFVINSRQELADIYLGKKELPAIDFDKYTLIIGQQNMPCLGFYVAKKELIAGDKGLILNLYARNDDELLACATQNLYFWGLYPKQSQKTITLNVYKEYTHFPDDK